MTNGDSYEIKESLESICRIINDSTIYGVLLKDIKTLQNKILNIEREEY